MQIFAPEIWLTLNIIYKKEGAYFVLLAPAFAISGYGITLREAAQSFAENVKLFCEDLLALPSINRDRELLDLGFQKVSSTPQF